MRGGMRAINCGDGGMSSNCPNWSDRHFFLRVLVVIAYDLRISGIPRAFSDGIRPGNPVLLQLGILLTHYSGLWREEMKKPGWIRVFLIVACTSIFLQSSGAFCADLGEKESPINFTLPPPDSERTQTYL